jgi:acyl-CoA reductase-like NAD-dependent aldehyde dehydrogenase
MIARKAGAALAAGCSVIVKPSEETPLTALALAELSTRAGFPPGVVNVVVCKAAQNSCIVSKLLDASCVRVVSFTGSISVGREIGAVAAKAGSVAHLELGGNAAAVVFDDVADIAQAARDIVTAKFRFAGQTCVCVNRVFVQDGVWDEFVAAAGSLVTELGEKVGNGLSERVRIGPLIRRRAVRRVSLLVADAVAKGAVVAIGGHVGTQPHVDAGPCSSDGEEEDEMERDCSNDTENGDLGGDGGGRDAFPDSEAVRMKIHRAGNGADANASPPSSRRQSVSHIDTAELAHKNFYMPTLLTGCTTGMEIHSTEIFGPVLAIYRFANEGDGMAAISSGCPGGSLAHYVYTGGVGRAGRAMRAAYSGMVGVNVCSAVSDARVRFGGPGNSGSAREGGEGALGDFSSWKYCIMNNNVA